MSPSSKMHRSAGSRAFGGDAGAQPFEHIVEVGQGQERVRGQLSACDGRRASSAISRMTLLLRLCGRGEGEGVEATGFGVSWIVADAKPSARP